VRKRRELEREKAKAPFVYAIPGQERSGMVPMLYKVLKKRHTRIEFRPGWSTTERSLSEKDRARYEKDRARYILDLK